MMLWYPTDRVCQVAHKVPPWMQKWGQKKPFSFLQVCMLSRSTLWIVSVLHFSLYAVWKSVSEFISTEGITQPDFCEEWRFETLLKKIRAVTKRASGPCSNTCQNLKV